LYKANLRERGKELTVHFEVDGKGRGIPCQRSGCEYPNQGGTVMVTTITHNGVELSPRGTLWHRVSARLESLFSQDLCADHLDELAEGRNIILE
jgi:hypothetical protein